MPAIYALEKIVEKPKKSSYIVNEVARRILNGPSGPLE